MDIETFKIEMRKLRKRWAEQDLHPWVRDGGERMLLTYERAGIAAKGPLGRLAAWRAADLAVGSGLK